MILLTDERIKSFKGLEESSLFMSILFLLNQEFGLKLNPAKIDIYYTQVKAKYEDLTIENVFEFFNVKATLKSESVSYKLKKNEVSIVKYTDEATELSQYVIGVGNIVCYNPHGKILKGKAVESTVIKFK